MAKQVTTIGTSHVASVVEIAVAFFFVKSHKQKGKLLRMHVTSLYLKRCGLLPLHCAYSKRIQSKQYTQNWPDDDATDLNNKAREMAKITAYVRVHLQLIIVGKTRAR